MDAFLTFIRDHVFFAIILFGMSITAATLVIWRLLLNSAAKDNMDEFWPRFQDTLKQKGADGALKMCRKQTGVITRRLLATGLENSPHGLAAMRRSMANVIELEIVPDLNFLLPTILAIAKIATMVGLLGTVISMIGTFQVLGETGQKAVESQASREIGLALFATALGLMTAIPLVFCHVLFKAWVHKFEIQMKREAQKLLMLMQSTKPTSGGRKTAVPDLPTV